jgi:AcrR family transcriptional regulator
MDVHEHPFRGEPTDSRERIFHATFRVLQEHGYAGLSISRIADAADLSKSSCYHFFDDKDDLLVSFMDYVLASFGGTIGQRFADDPLTDLRLHLLVAILGPDADRVHEALDDDLAPDPDLDAPPSREPIVELRAQAVHDDAFRARFVQVDAVLRENLAGMIQTGIDAGDFNDVDVDQVADFLVTTVMGSIFRRTTTSDDGIAGTLAELDDYLQRRLVAD